VPVPNDGRPDRDRRPRRHISHSAR
jgi:hypothetical protein